MFTLDKENIKLTFWFQGYYAPEHRYDDDSWASFHARIETEQFSIESNYTNIESESIDYLRKMFEKFLNNEMEENEYFSSIEEGFSICFYPKGFYGYTNKKIELSIALPEGDWVSSSVSIKFELNENETKELYNYICHVINNEI